MWKHCIRKSAPKFNTTKITASCRSPFDRGGSFASPSFQTNKMMDISWLINKIYVSGQVTGHRGESPVTGEFPSQRPVTQSFDVFFNLRLNKRLSKKSRHRWFDLSWSYFKTRIRNHNIFVTGIYKLRSVQNTGTCYPGQGWFVRNLGWGLGSMSRYSAQILICFIAYIFLIFSSLCGFGWGLCRTASMHSALCHCPL